MLFALRTDGKAWRYPAIAKEVYPLRDLLEHAHMTDDDMEVSPYMTYHDMDKCNSVFFTKNDMDKLFQLDNDEWQVKAYTASLLNALNQLSDDARIICLFVEGNLAKEKGWALPDVCNLQDYMPVGYFTVEKKTYTSVVYEGDTYYDSESVEFRLKALPEITTKGLISEESETLHLKEVMLPSNGKGQLCFYKNKNYYPIIQMEVPIRHCSTVKIDEVALTETVHVTNEEYFKKALRDKIKKNMKFDDDQGYFYLPR
jgi:hypothetical protein